MQLFGFLTGVPEIPRYHLDRDMRMGSYVRLIAERATKALAAMRQLMPKTYGSREMGKALFAFVVQSVILYAAQSS